MDKHMRRQWAATEAQSYGHGEVSAVTSATGMSRNTIRKGVLKHAARRKHPRTPVPERARHSSSVERATKKIATKLAVRQFHIPISKANRLAAIEPSPAREPENHVSRCHEERLEFVRIPVASERRQIARTDQLFREGRSWMYLAKCFGERNGTIDVVRRSF